MIPIPPEGRRYFQYFAQQAEGPLLLSGYIGQRVPNNFWKRSYYPLLDKLGITRKIPYVTRHTYAGLACRAGMPQRFFKGFWATRTTAPRQISMFIWMRRN